MATFLLLHGAWHAPSCWDQVTELLESLGHTPVAPDLPLHDPHAGYEERTRPAIDALEGAGDEAVVVAQRRQGTRRSSRGAA